MIFSDVSLALVRGSSYILGMEYYLADDITPAPPAVSQPVTGPNVTLLPGGEVRGSPAGYVTVEGGGEVSVPGSGHVVVPGAGQVRIPEGVQTIPQPFDVPQVPERHTGAIVDQVA